MVVERPGDYWRVPSVAQDYEAERFHHVKGYVYRRLEERAIQRALRGLGPGTTLLDAACGTGRVTALLRRRGFRPTGCDISRAMMSVARRQLAAVGDDVPLVENTVEALPFRDKSFDAVTCIGLLMHLDTDVRRRALRELARVSRGRLVIQYVCTGALLRVKSYVTGRPTGGVRYPVSQTEMRMDFEESGLTERARFWILRGLSSSVIVVLTR
jgi:ubiquinone/menaquinone biosynthesis C-methylase UbiE